jgi:NADH:ubiquinone oxidoreductase subunit 5 (subunit L)/multisubunit Na+/H+ antiporter MnhA subunit
MSAIIVLQLAVFLPLFASGLIAACGRSREDLIARIASVAVALMFGNQIVLTGMFYDRTDTWQFALPFSHHQFNFMFRADLVGLVFGALTALFSLTIVRFSRVYMHRETGFRRFFVMIFLLAGGMQILALADSLATFFIGWELIGIASFVLIAFYREQKNSVRNALKVFAVYRIGDIGLFFGTLSLHLSGAGDSFGQLLPPYPVSGLLYFAVAGIILAAMAKSAQFPFSFWLPRAMEGPTPSSAIFYGALSVHAGIILLAKLQPVWQSLPGVPAVIVGVGLVTAVLAQGASRVHPSIKGRLAMSSVTQVGLIFAEIGLGLDQLALYHTVAHALMRSGQILISPSIISHLLRIKAAGLQTPFSAAPSIEKLLPPRLRATLWVLAFQDHLIEHRLTRAYYALADVLSVRNAPYIGVMVASFLISAAILTPDRPLMFSVTVCGLAGLMSVIAIVAHLSFRARLAFTATSLALTELVLIRLNTVDATLAVTMVTATVMLVSTVTLLIPADINGGSGFSGTWKKYPVRSTVIFICAAMLAGIPPSPLFFVEDIAWSGLISLSVPLAFILGLIHAMNGVALFKAAAYLTMGPEQMLRPAPKAVTQAVTYAPETSQAR